jgi:hypothetical protein
VTRATVSTDGETIIVHIPLTFRKRGGLKLVVTPDRAEWPQRPRVDNAMVKALAWGFRWRKMLDTGVYATLDDLAKAKGVAPSYVSRVLRLTLLAPDIVATSMGGSRLSCRGAISARPLRLYRPIKDISDGSFSPWVFWAR